MAHTEPLPRFVSNAEILLWQSWIRIGVAVVAGGTELLLQTVGVLRGSSVLLFQGIAGYLAIVALLAMRLRRARRASEWMVSATILADLTFIFGSTLVSSPPAYYDRILIFAFLVLHFTEFYFGRVQASAALGAVVVGYLLMVWGMTARGTPLVWAEEVWSLAVFVLVAFVFVLQYGNFRRRLHTLARLFRRAEEGDFSQPYDVDADSRPDAITTVGRAYNRVRTQLATMVLTDPLTGCLNRRGFEQQLEREVARAARHGGEIALLAIDLDHFKRINDSYGHLVGDAVLREAGRLLREVGRAGDVVARIGGEEFMFLLPGTDEGGALALGERICERFRQHNFPRTERTPVTVSVGVVADRITDENSVEALRSRSDEALYVAKRDGRNCVRLWREGAHTARVSGDYQMPPGGGTPARP